MKTIAAVLQLTERAKKNADKSEQGTGYAVQNRREVVYNWGGSNSLGEMREVYRVEYIKGDYHDAIINLYHYETLTAEILLDGGVTRLGYVYGESRSDADSINTLLAYLNIENRYTFRPVNGGFMRVDNL